MNRRLFLQSAAAIVAGTALTTACSPGGGGGSTNGKKDAAKAVSALKVRLGTAADSQGPVTVKGAVKGGTVTIIEALDLAHTDPGRVYDSQSGNLAQLIHRRLTSYKRVGDELILVGDLATDTGTASDDNKTWTFTLKDGVKFSDGTAVTSKHIKYAVERLCDTDITDGPTYLPIWLYGEKFSGSTPDDAAIETPDDKTIVFHLKDSQTDFPFACAYAVTAPVLEKYAKDKDAFDKTSVGTGPYKFVSRTDTKIVLERNEHWDADTDPVRGQYPDGFEYTIGTASPQLSQELANATGDGSAKMTTITVVDPTYLQRVGTDAELKSRTLSERGITLRYAGINCKRITDVQVRKALMTAFPKAGVRGIFGGAAYGDIATDVLTPVTLGYTKNDVYGLPEAGDPAAAKKLLKKAGKTGQKIVFAYSQSDMWDKAVLVVKKALEQAGFEVVAKTLDPATYWTQIGATDNEFDMFVAGWTPDWPTGAGTIPTAFDGRLIFDGSANYCMYDTDEVNAEIDRIANEVTDPEEAGRAWSALDKKIMEDAPIIPWGYEAKTYLHGERLGGGYVAMSPTGFQATQVYVKQ
jgi:peptide/nickel transport system substrate-binding protein